MAKEIKPVNMTEYKLLRIFFVFDFVIIIIFLILPVSQLLRSIVLIILGITYIRLMVLRWRIVKRRKALLEDFETSGGKFRAN